MSDDAQEPAPAIWTTNIPSNNADALLRLYNGNEPDHTFEVGEPLRSFRYTVDELKAQGVVGIYARKKHG